MQLVKKFPAFHGTRRFITALTSVRHLSLSWARPIQSVYPHSTSWRSILILSTHLRLCLPSSLFPSGFPTKSLYTPSPHPYVPKQYNTGRQYASVSRFVDTTRDFMFKLDTLTFTLSDVFHPATCFGSHFDNYQAQTQYQYKRKNALQGVSSLQPFVFLYLSTE